VQTDDPHGPQPRGPNSPGPARISGNEVIPFLRWSARVLGVLLAGPIRDHGWLSILLGSRFGNLATGAALFGVAMLTGSDRFRVVLDPGHRATRRVVALLILAGVCDTAAFSFFAIGLEQAPVWIVTLASSLGPVLVVLFAIAQLGERLRPVQWLGLAALAGGLGVLAVAS